MFINFFSCPRCLGNNIGKINHRDPVKFFAPLFYFGRAKSARSSYSNSWDRDVTSFTDWHFPVKKENIKDFSNFHIFGLYVKKVLRILNQYKKAYLCNRTKCFYHT